MENTGRRHPIGTRLHAYGRSDIREMIRLCREYGAINLVGGIPDFPAPAFIKEAAKAAIDGDYNQYPPPHGTPSLCAAVAGKYRRLYGMEVDPESMVTITCGATEALSAAMLALLPRDTEVVLFEPFYDVLLGDAALGDIEPIFVRLEYPEFTLDLDRLAAAVSSRSAAIVLNSPHNPTGRVFSREELSGIAEICTRFQLLAITNEVYEHIVFEGAHIPLATMPGMAERTITISSFSKTFSVTGWRVGTVVAPPAITAEIRKVHDLMTVGAATPLQEACAAALEHHSEYYATLVAEYEERLSVLYDALCSAGLRPLRPQGALYVLVDAKQVGFEDALSAAQWFLREVGVAGVPLGSFYGRPECPQFVRFTFARRLETLRAAAERFGRVARRVLGR